MLDTKHVLKGCRSAEFVSCTFGLSDGQVDEVTDDYWSGSCSGSRPVCHVGNGDRFVCHCLSFCRPPGERTYVFVFSFVCRCLHECVWCTPASLGYPLQPVQETNKLHFNMRNINFSPGWQANYGCGAPTPNPVQGAPCHCWKVKSAAVTAADQCINWSRWSNAYLSDVIAFLRIC